MSTAQNHCGHLDDIAALESLHAGFSGLISISFKQNELMELMNISSIKITSKPASKRYRRKISDFYNAHGKELSNDKDQYR